MTIPMYGTQFPQQGYGYGMGYPYPGVGYPGYAPQQPAGGGTDPNAILGAIIQPLMSLVMSMLTGTPAEEHVCTEPGGGSGSTDPGTSDATLGPDSEASDYLDVLSENDSELKDLERKFGDRDGKLSASEVSKILRKIEKGDTKGIDVSADLQAALTWLDQDPTGQTVFANLANEFDEDGDAAIDVKKGFDESVWEDVDGDIEEDLGPVDAEEAIQYLVDNDEFAAEIAGADKKITQAEIDEALKSDDYSLEEKAQLRFIRENFEDITDAMYEGDNQPISLGDLASKLESDAEANGENIVDELQDIEPED